MTYMLCYVVPILKMLGWQWAAAQRSWCENFC